MHKTRVDRRFEKFFGATMPTPPKTVKRRGQYWFTELSGNLCYHSSTSYHLLDEVAEWLDSHTPDWYVNRIENQYDWNKDPILRLFVPSLELITEFRLSWGDHNS